MRKGGEPMAKPQANTTSRGLGWNHQRQRGILIANHTQGSKCWWCDKPMYREAAKNWDSKPLEADHTNPRSKAGPHNLADRLLHSTCNRQRGDGSKDHARPALGKPEPQPQEPTPGALFDFSHLQFQ